MSKRTLNIFATILLLLAVIIVSLSMMTAPKHSKWVLLSGAGAKCLEVEGGRVVKGAPLVGASCHGRFSQQFDITFRDGPIKVGDLCVDLAHGSKKDGTQLILWTCHGGSAQVWLYDSQLNTLVNRNSKCMDLAGGEKSWNNVQPVVLWSCNRYTNQKWYLSKKMLTTEISGGNIIKPNMLYEVKPPQNIFAATNGILLDSKGKKDHGLPETQAKLKVDYDRTLVELDFQKVLVPAKALFEYGLTSSF